MTVDRMIELLRIEHECMLRKSHDGCDGQCDACELVQDDGELHEMYTNVIDFLNEEKPRVISINEIKAVSFVWLEDVDKKKVIPALFCWRGESVAVYAVVWRFIRVQIDEYGSRWRAWTRWPNDEQREAEAWRGL